LKSVLKDDAHSTCGYRHSDSSSPQFERRARPWARGFQEDNIHLSCRKPGVWSTVAPIFILKIEESRTVVPSKVTSDRRRYNGLSHRTLLLIATEVDGYAVAGFDDGSSFLDIEPIEQESDTILQVWALDICERKCDKIRECLKHRSGSYPSILHIATLPLRLFVGPYCPHRRLRLPTILLPEIWINPEQSALQLQRRRPRQVAAKRPIVGCERLRNETFAQPVAP
jgi:hypothetical protein